MLNSIHPIVCLWGRLRARAVTSFGSQTHIVDYNMLLNNIFVSLLYLSCNIGYSTPVLSSSTYLFCNIRHLSPATLPLFAAFLSALGGRGGSGGGGCGGGVSGGCGDGDGGGCVGGGGALTLTTTPAQPPPSPSPRPPHACVCVYVFLCVS